MRYSPPALTPTWVGKGQGASQQAAVVVGPIQGLHFRLGGIDSSDPAGYKDVEWIEGADLRLGDESRIRMKGIEPNVSS